MKQCPECREVFEEGVNFCELDGVRLVDQLTEIREIIQPPPYHLGPNVSGTLATVVIGVLIGVVLTLFGFVFFLFHNRATKLLRSVNLPLKAVSARNNLSPPHGNVRLPLH